MFSAIQYPKDFEIIKSTKEKDAILFQGYFYNHKNDNKDGIRILPTEYKQTKTNKGPVELFSTFTTFASHIGLIILGCSDIYDKGIKFFKWKIRNHRPQNPLKNRMSTWHTTEVILVKQLCYSHFFLKGCAFPIKTACK